MGANLGDGAAAMRAALGALDARADTAVMKVSSLYCSAPLDATGPDYVNAVAQLSTSLQPQALLDLLLLAELRAGRERPYRNAPRTLDLDLLLYGDQRMSTPTLVLPHPRMWERAFVLLPLAELCPELVTSAQLSAVAGQAIQRCGALADPGESSSVQA